jgi:DHA1 family bicyclomycin/chloramphenicol resistance-like MFS transporter
MEDVSAAQARTAVETARDRGLTLALGSAAVLGGAAIDAYAPGLPQIAKDFGVTSSAAQLSLTTYMIGFAVGQFTAGPVSDALGRRRPLLAAAAAFTLFSLACAAAPSLAVLCMLRFGQGFTGTFGMAIGRAVVRDLYDGAFAARMLSRIVMVLGISPLLAPILGGAILSFASWRGIFVGLAVLGALAVVLMAMQIPETLPPERRRSGGMTGAARTMASLLRDRRTVGLALTTACSAAATITAGTGTSYVVQDHLGGSAQLYSLLYATGGAAVVAGTNLNSRLVVHRQLTRLVWLGIALMSLSALLYVVASTAGGNEAIALIWPAFAVLPLSWAFVQVNTVVLALSAHPDRAGAASSLLGTSQYTLTAIATPLVGVTGSVTAKSVGIVVAIGATGALVSFGLIAGRAR